MSQSVYFVATTPQQEHFQEKELSHKRSTLMAFVRVFVATAALSTKNLISGELKARNFSISVWPKKFRVWIHCKTWSTRNSINACPLKLFNLHVFYSNKYSNTNFWWFVLVTITRNWSTLYWNWTRWPRVLNGYQSVYRSEGHLLPVSSAAMDRCFGTSSALLLFHLALNLLPWLAEFSYTSYLPDYLYLNSSEILCNISQPH